nr:TetR/AcrR family transcriptional regulator [Sphingomonas sp. CDS-1]
MSASGGDVHEKEDYFRVRVARQKRERMRGRLLAATMSLCAERRGSGPLVIDDVVQRADVSRGTFYKYFDSVGAAVEEVGRQAVDDLVAALRVLVADQSDPLMRICLGNCALLTRAAIEPAWGGFVGHSVYVNDAQSIRLGMREAVISSCAAGAFDVPNVEVAVDFHIGLALQGIRRVVRSGFDEAYIRDVATLATTGLGVDRGRGSQIAARAMELLFAKGPTVLGWWPKDEAAFQARPDAALADTTDGDRANVATGSGAAS